MIPLAIIAISSQSNSLDGETFVSKILEHFQVRKNV